MTGHCWSNESYEVGESRDSFEVLGVGEDLGNHVHLLKGSLQGKRSTQLLLLTKHKLQISLM
jgi:hypothetical protein